MAQVISTLGLFQALQFEGMDMPDDCYNVVLEFEADSTYKLSFHCHLSDENVQRVGRALQRLAEAAIEERERERIRKAGTTETDPGAP